MNKDTMKKEITKVMNWIEAEDEKGNFRTDKKKVKSVTDYLRKLLSDMDKDAEK